MKQFLRRETRVNPSCRVWRCTLAFKSPLREKRLRANKSQERSDCCAHGEFGYRGIEGCRCHLKHAQRLTKRADAHAVAHEMKALDACARNSHNHVWWNGETRGPGEHHIRGRNERPILHEGLRCACHQRQADRGHKDRHNSPRRDLATSGASEARFERGNAMRVPVGQLNTKGRTCAGKLANVQSCPISCRGHGEQDCQSVNHSINQASIIGVNQSALDFYGGPLLRECLRTGSDIISGIRPAPTRHPLSQLLLYP